MTNDRLRTARLAAAYANTPEGTLDLRDTVDLDRIYRLCDTLNLTLPYHVRAVPNEAVLDLNIHSPALQRTVVLQLSIADNPAQLTATAEDRSGPVLRPRDVSGYLATAELTTVSLMSEVRAQLAMAAHHIYKVADQLQADPAGRDPGRAWVPGAAAIDALSALLEQDARFKAQSMINHWYVNAVRASEKAEIITARTGVQISADGIRIAQGDPVHLLPDNLRELLNEHWRAVYVRTVHEQLGIIDALDTPGEQAMRNNLEAQEDLDARRRASKAFPDRPGPSSQASPDSRRPDEHRGDDRDTGTGR